MSARLEVVHFQRKPVAGWHSIERLFSDVRAHLPPEISVRLEVCRHASRGLWPRLRSVVEAVSRQGEVNHVTGDVHFITLLMRRRRTILTITDCLPLERLGGLRRLVVWLFWYWLPIHRVRTVTVISEVTRQELIRHVRCDPEKIRVIHCSLSPVFRADPRQPGEGRRRLLVVGTTPNKNLERIAEALRGLAVRVVLIGRPSNAQLAAFRVNGIELEVLSGLSDDALVEQYRASHLLLFPSTYEGFGLPIIEANAVGRPVVTSDRSSMPEVAGDAACLVDPFDAQSIRSGVLRVLEDADYRRQLIEAGFRNAERFRPERIAAEYAALYLGVAREAP